MGGGGNFMLTWFLIYKSLVDYSHDDQKLD